MTSGARSRSAAVSNNGTTRSGRSTPAACCSTCTARMSDAWRVIVMMYAPSDSRGIRAIMRNVSSTSVTSGSAETFAASGRCEPSSPTRKSTRFDSSHSAYDPRPRTVVMAASAAACLSDS